MKKENKFIPFNLQLFAEDGEGDGTDNGGNEKTLKTYSEEEYLKLKASFDKASSELAEAKKRERAKLTDEEKKAKEQEEVNQKLADYESKFEDYALKEELLKCNLFNNDEITSIVKEKNDKPKLLAKIVELFNSKIDNIKKEAVDNFMKSSDVGGTKGGNEKTTDKDVQSYIDSKKNDRTNKAREYFLKK